MYLELCDIRNCKSWAKRMHSVIDHLGFTNVRFNFDASYDYFHVLKSRLRDQFVQEWRHNITSLSKLDLYCKYKENFEFETYLDVVKNDRLRKILSQFRLSSHSLEIEVGRYSNIERANRICKLCNQNTIESEYHFMLCCSQYTTIRNKYIGHISWPNIHTFKYLMMSKNTKRLLNVARFVNEAMDIRKNALENLIVL